MSSSKRPGLDPSRHQSHSQSKMTSTIRPHEEDDKRQLSELSVRPKKLIPKKQEKVGESLDKRSITFYDRSGVKHTSSALDTRFCPFILFPKFESPPLPLLAKPESPTGQARLDQWLNDVSLLESSLQQLLRLSYHRFWSAVQTESSLQVAIDSYLRNTPRFYDLGSSLERFPDNVRQAINSIHNLVLKVLIRMTTLRENERDFLSEEAFANLITKHNLFDLPRLLDILSVYWFTCGDDCKKLIRGMFDRVMNSSSTISGQLTELVSGIITFLDQMKERLGVDANELESSCNFSQLSWEDFLNTLTSIADFAISLYCITYVSSAFCKSLHDNFVEQMLIHFYEACFPLLEREVDKRFLLTNGFHVSSSNVNHSTPSQQPPISLESVRKQLLRTKCMLIMTCRHIIYGSSIQPLLDPTIDHRSKSLYIDALFDVMTLIQSEKHFSKDFSRMFSLRSDINQIRSNSNITGFTEFDSNRFLYLIKNEPAAEAKRPIDITDEPKKEEVKPHATDLNQEENKKLKKSKKRVTITDETSGDLNHDNIEGIEEAELLSLISGIEDILPHLGKGFIIACLEQFKFDHEKTLNALLTEDLPKAVKDLPTNLTRTQWNEMKAPKKTQQRVPEVIQTRANIYDGDEFDIYRNEKVDLSRIHVGKKEDKLETTLDPELKAKTKALNEQLLIKEEEEQLALLAEMGITDPYELYVG